MTCIINSFRSLYNRDTIKIEQSNKGPFGFMWSFTSKTQGVIGNENIFQTITIKKGDEINFKGNLKSGHNFCIKKDNIIFKSIYSEKWNYNFYPKHKGKYKYYCEPHEMMMYGYIHVI